MEEKETGGEIQDRKERSHMTSAYRSMNVSSDLLSLSVLRGSPFFETLKARPIYGREPRLPSETG